MLGPFPFLALVKRELLTTLRSGKVYLGLCLFTLTSIVVVGLQWPRGDVRLLEAAYYADDLFNGLKIALVIGCALVVPGIAGAAIALEKEKESFDLVYMTLVRPSGLVAAKLIGVVGVYLLLVAAVLPVFGCIAFLVGFDPIEIVSALGMVVLFTLSCAGWGLLCSALFRRTTFAIIGGYLCLIFTMGGPLLAGLAICQGLNLHDLGSFFEWAFFLLTPFGVLFEKYETWETVAALAFQAGMAALALLATLMLVRRPPAPARVRSDKPIDDARVLDRRRRRFPFYLFDPQARRGPIPDWVNPVLVKDFRFGFMGRAANMFRVAYVSFGVFVLVTGAFALSGIHDSNSANQRLELFLVSHLLEMLPIVLLATALAAPAITREAEIGNLDFLRQSRLSPGQIIRGKLGAAAATIAPLVIALCLANAFFVGPVEPDLKSAQVMATVYGTFLVCLLLAYGLGLLASVIVRKTNTSLMLGYGLTILILIGIFTAAMILKDLHVIRNWSDHDMAFLSPITILIENIDRYCKTWHDRSEWDPWSELWIVGMAGYTLLGTLIFAAGVALFSRLRMRER